MKLRDFGLLTDENLDPDVVAFLWRQGFDVSDVGEDVRAALAKIDGSMDSTINETRGEWSP